MRHGSLLPQRSILFIVSVLFALMLSSVAHSQEVTVVTPHNGATVSGTVAVTLTLASNVSWANFYIDGKWRASTPPLTWSWNTNTETPGAHTVAGYAYTSSAYLGGALVNVTVANGTGGSAPGGGSGWSVPQGATISGMDGSSSNISWADSNPANYGNYRSWGGGFALMDGPLLTNLQAASFVKATQKSNVETGSNGWANGQANNYFNDIATNNPGWYWTQINAFRTGYQGISWQTEANRIDGACPIANPTTAEVLQWAGNKWGINPLLLYADTTGEGSWDQTSLGDNGTSSGLMQVADRGANHAAPGFDGNGSNLARESSCFNADFWAARLFSAFHGITGQSPSGNMDAAIQSWFDGSASSGGWYSNEIYGFVGNQQWRAWDFNGASVPY